MNSRRTWRPVFSNAPLLAILAVMLAGIGCGGAPKNEVFDIRTLQGKVDANLPRDAQAKQEILRRLLNGLQEGIGDQGALNLFVPGVEYREDFARFYDGNKRLVRWDFNGPPVRDELPVVLFFDDVESGPVDPAKEKRVERVYLVSGGGSRYYVSRK